MKKWNVRLADYVLGDKYIITSNIIFCIQYKWTLQDIKVSGEFLYVFHEHLDIVVPHAVKPIYNRIPRDPRSLSVSDSSIQHNYLVLGKTIAQYTQYMYLLYIHKPQICTTCSHVHCFVTM